MKVFIACSRHFYEKIPSIKQELEKAGHSVTPPNSYDEPFKEERTKEKSKEDHIKFKQEMMKLHEPKIKENDAILVLNLEKNGQPNYLGGGTFMEIVKAWELDKKIFLYNPIPNSIFTDELTGINPVIIDGDLSKVNSETFSNLDAIKSKIKTYADWPKEGIMFRDINSLLNDSEGLNLLTAELVKRYQDMDIDVIAGIESRGFITGSLLAHALNKKFVLIRKPGKLPGETISQEYTLEYGTDKVEIQKHTIKEGDKVLLVDDLIATGGTALASAQLIQKLGGKIVECSFVIDLPEVGGKQKLLDNGLNVFSLVDFEGE